MIASIILILLATEFLLSNIYLHGKERKSRFQTHYNGWFGLIYYIIIIVLYYFSGVIDKLPIDFK